jgi:phosphoribosylanthranilate isomerase
MRAEKLFQIKICGITTVDDAVVAVEAGADAIGLNFWPQSKRRVGADTAREISAKLRDVVRVGVFVNATADDITRTADAVDLDWIQLHGDEPAELLAQLPGQLKVMRAFRCGEDGLKSASLFLSKCRNLERVPDAVLADADAGAEYGGTGRIANWSQIVSERDQLGGVPMILAGGLTPQNVAEAIAATRPDGVDVASGVESRPGVKDAKLVREFIDAARLGFSQL